MKKMRNVSLILTLFVVLMLALPTRVSAAPLEDDRTVFGSNYTLESGRILDGDLNVFGGVVEIEENAAVNGDMFVLGGLVSIDGTIQGNLTVVGGTVTLEDNAVIEGDLVSPASYINQESGAVIQGNQVEGWNIPWSGFEMPIVHRPAFRTPGVQIVPLITRLGRAAVTLLVLLGLAALMLLIMPEATGTMSRALLAQPWAVLGFGALTAVVMVFGGILLSLTICLIPLVILAALMVALGTLAGWLALGYELGKRMAADIFKTDWHPVLSAVLGNLVLYLLARGLGLIPCLGAFLVFITMLFALGTSVVTLFGAKPYPRSSEENADHAQIILSTSETPAAEETDAILLDEAAPEPVGLQHPIEDLDLGTRTTNALKAAGLETVEEAQARLSQGDEALLEIDGFGKKSLNDLKEALKEKGYQA